MANTMHLDLPSPPELMDAETPTPGGSTVVTPSIVLPPELRPLSKPTTTTAAAPADAADPVDALDLSLPLSTLLRESTKIAHTQAEHSPGAIALAGGTLRVQEYVRYLALLWVVYTVLEREIERHVPAGGEGVEADVLALLWDEKSGGKGRMLRRSESLTDDIEYFVSRLSEEERSTPAYSATATTTTTSTIPTPPFPIPAFLQGVWQTPPPALTQFTTHLHHISATRPALLLAHAYVRYLGDLSGGQIVRGKIRRVYALPSSTTTGPSSSTRGTRFYEFDAVAGDIPVAGEAQQVQGHGHGQESMYERKLKMGEVKDWFRRVLDSGTADGREDLKRALINEAIECFHLSTHIFSALDPAPADAPSSSTLGLSGSHPDLKIAVKRAETPLSTAINNSQWLGRASLLVVVLAVLCFLLRD